MEWRVFPLIKKAAVPVGAAFRRKFGPPFFVAYCETQFRKKVFPQPALPEMFRYIGSVLFGFSNMLSIHDLMNS